MDCIWGPAAYFLARAYRANSMFMCVCGCRRMDTIIVAAGKQLRVEVEYYLLRFCSHHDC